MPAHQAREIQPLSPIAEPESRPRSVSVIGVNGWLSANQRSPGDIEPAGTNAEPRNGRNCTSSGLLLADSTVLEIRPSAAESQVTANAMATRRPAAASHASGPESDGDRHPHDQDGTEHRL